MSNILKKLSALIVMLVFMGLFSVVVSATETTQNTSIDGNVILSEDEYNDLIKRVEELEQLKADEINNNLFDYYEKSKADRETGISEMFDGVATVGTVSGVVVGIAGVLVAIAGIILVFNFTEVKSTVKKAEDTNIKANEKLSDLDETKLKLDLYIEKAKAQTTNDIDLSIEIYDKVINKMQELKLEDEYIFYERGNAYLSRFRFEAGILFNYKHDINTEIKNLERIIQTEYLNENYSNLLDNATRDFEKFLEKSPTNSLYIKTKLNIMECFIYKKEYNKAFMTLNDINYGDGNVEPLYKVIASIIIYPDLYYLFSSCITNDRQLFLSISKIVQFYEGFMFNRIFANEIVFNISSLLIGDRTEEEFEKYKNNVYTELMQKLDIAYNVCNKLTETSDAKGFIVYFKWLLNDFRNCTKVRNKIIESKDNRFSVLNMYSQKFLIALDDDRYKELETKINQIYNDVFI